MFIIGSEDIVTNVKFQIEDEFDGNQNLHSNVLYAPYGEVMLNRELNQDDRLPVDEEAEESFAALLKNFETKNTEELKRIIEEVEQSS